MKPIACILALFLSIASTAQEPAGSCIFIDYEAFQEDNVLRYINCGNDDMLNVGDNLTIQCWTRINDTNWNQKICGKNNGSFNSGYVMAIDQGDVYGEVWNPGLNEIHDGFIPPVQLWYHLAITFEAGEVMRGYVNGEMVQEVNVSGGGIVSNDDDFIIGIAPWDLANFQTFGELDELSVHNTAWSEADIRANMFKSDALADMVAYYDFNDGSGTSLTDASGNGNTGTFTGLTSNDWAPSRAPVGDAVMTPMEDVVGLWNGIGFTDPRFVITESGLSMSMSDQADLDYCVYGHDGGTGTQTENLPAGAPANFASTERSWYVTEAGTLTTTLSFNLTNAAGGGDALDSTQPVEHYTLMYRGDAGSAWQFLAQADDVTGSVVSFGDFSVATGYYAVGYGDGPAVITTSLQDLAAPEVGVYPSPASAYVTVDLSGISSGNALLRLVNAQGQTVSHHLLRNGSAHRLEVADLAKGTYVAVIETGRGVVRQRLVIR